MRLDPLNPNFYLANVGFADILQGRYAEAILVFKKVLARYPNHIAVRLMLALAYSEVGEEAAAREQAAEVLRCMSSQPFGQVSERSKRESGPSGLKLGLSPDGEAAVFARSYFV
jgi:predicted Zn-dependent protease